MERGNKPSQKQKRRREWKKVKRWYVVTVVEEKKMSSMTTNKIILYYTQKWIVHLFWSFLEGGITFVLFSVEWIVYGLMFVVKNDTTRPHTIFRFRRNKSSTCKASSKEKHINLSYSYSFETFRKPFSGSGETNYLHVRHFLTFIYTHSHFLHVRHFDVGQL